jgi:hypothetical protein
VNGDIGSEIRAELRSILRQQDDLRRPLESFGEVLDRNAGEPRYYVLFDQNPRLVINGVRFGGSKLLNLPDERILDRALEYAKSVWQLKDRLKLWVKANALPIDVEAEGRKSPDLCICADLANWKKHGENKYKRSGVDPRVNLVTFDTSQNGGLEIYYDGATKRQELLVTIPSPIPYWVEVVGNGGQVKLGKAVEIIDRGFADWLPAINSMGGLTGNDRENEYLRKRLFPAA